MRKHIRHCVDSVQLHVASRPRRCDRSLLHVRRRLRRIAAAPFYAIRGARIVTVAGAPIDKGTVVMRNGVIDDVGANVDRAGRRRRRRRRRADGVSGPDRHGQHGRGRDVRPAAAAGGGGRGAPPAGGGGGRGARRRRRSRRSRIWSASNARTSSGRISKRRATCASTAPKCSGWRRRASRACWRCRRRGCSRGQSALINVARARRRSADQHDRRLPPRPRRREIAGRAARRHFRPAAGGGGYPGSLLGYIAFMRQSFYDAQWQRDARRVRAIGTRTRRGRCSSRRSTRCCRRSSARCRWRSTRARSARFAARSRWRRSSTSIRSSSARRRRPRRSTISRRPTRA